MNRIVLGLLAFMFFGAESVLAHGGVHPTPAPPPPSSPPAPMPPPPPPSPSVSAPAFIVVPQASSTGSYNVYWGAVAGVTGFELEEDNRVGFPNPWRYTLSSSVTAVLMNGRPNGTWYYRVRAVTSGAFSTWRTGLNGCLVLLRGTLNLSIGTASPASIWKLPGDLAVEVMQLALSVDQVENMTINSLTFHGTGSLNDANDIDAVTLYRDLNGNGTLEAGTDVLLGGPVVFGVDDGSVTFSALAATILAGTMEQWLVVIDLSPGAPFGGTFQIAVQSNTDLSATGSVSSNSPIVLGAPVQGGQLTVRTSSGTPGPTPFTVGSLRIAAGPANPGHGEIPRGSVKNEVLHLALEAGPGEPIRVDTLVLTHFGTLREPSGLITFSLHADSNGNGVLDENDRVIRGPVPILPDSTNLLFLGLGEEILAGGKIVWFVTADVLKEVKIGSTMGVNLDCEHLLSVKGTTSNSSVPIQGLPILGPEMTVVEAEAAPPSTSPRHGLCGGSPSGDVPPQGLFGLGLLLLVFLATLRLAAHRSRNQRPSC